MTQSSSEHSPLSLGLRIRRISLQTRLVLFMLFTALVPLIFISMRNIIQAQQAYIKSAETSLLSDAERTASNLDSFINNVLNSSKIESQFTDFSSYLEMAPSLRSGSLEGEHARDLLEKLGRKDPINIVSYALLDVNGVVLMDTAKDDSRTNESNDLYFRKVQMQDQPLVTTVTYSNGATTVIHFASKILSQRGDYVGVLRIMYNSAILQSVITEGIGTSTDAAILVLDELNIRMADSQNPELILKSIVPLELSDYLLAVESKRFLNLPSEEQATHLTDLDLALKNADTQPFFRADISPNKSGDESIAVAHMQTQPWVVIYSRPTSVFLTDIHKQTNTNILLLILTTFAVVILATLVARIFTRPILELADIANSVSLGNLNIRAEENTSDEIGTIASVFNSITNQLQSKLGSLEEHVSKQTADLQKDNVQLKAITDVMREIIIIRDLNTLLKVSVNLIKERLDYYHVGIFLVDELGEYAILRAASSIAAEEMLMNNYKLKVSQKDLVGKSTKNGQAYIALDVGIDAIHFENPLLPETHSEIALPLRNRNLTIGALDIQTKAFNAFSERDIQTLQLLADQLSAAIEKTQLAQQVEATMLELTKVNRQQTQRAWKSPISKREFPAYEYDGLQVTAVQHNLPLELLKKLENGKPIIVKQSTDHQTNVKQNTLLIPLILLNQVIGVIGLEQENPAHIWTDEEIAIALAAANRAALSLENSRLLEDSQKRAAREQAISNISAKIGAGVEIESIIKTAISELGNQISGAQVTVELGSADE